MKSINAIGSPQKNEAWGNAIGSPSNKSIWNNAIGSPQRNTEWANASGVGAITYNVKSGAFEDSKGKKYTPNDDNITFDDGTGINYNADGSLVKSKGALGGFFDKLVTTVTSQDTINSVIDLAKQKVNADTTLNTQQKQLQISQLDKEVKTTTSWVMPVAVVGGLIAAGVAYYYFVKKHK